LACHSSTSAGRSWSRRFVSLVQLSGDGPQ
jgi:hypothetical protein